MMINVKNYYILFIIFFDIVLKIGGIRYKYIFESFNFKKLLEINEVNFKFLNVKGNFNDVCSKIIDYYDKDVGKFYIL